MPDLTSQLVQQLGAGAAAVGGLVLVIRQYLRTERYSDMAEGIAKLSTSATTELIKPLQEENARLRVEVSQLLTEVEQLREVLYQNGIRNLPPHIAGRSADA